MNKKKKAPKRDETPSILEARCEILAVTSLLKQGVPERELLRRLNRADTILQISSIALENWIMMATKRVQVAEAKLVALDEYLATI